MKRINWQTALLIGWAILLAAFAWLVEDTEPERAEFAKSAPDEPSAASGDAELWFVAKDIYINGTHVNNFEAEHPLFLNGDRLYIPSDDAWKSSLGFEVSISQEEGLMLLEKTEPSAESPESGRLASNLQDASGEVRRGFFVATCEDIDREAGKSPQAIKIEEEDALRHGLWLSRFPWLSYFGLGKEDGMRSVMHESAAYIDVQGVPYLPIDWFTDSEVFGWDVYIDDISGVYISTEAGVFAKSFYSANNASYIEGLARFMMSWNRELSFDRAVYYEYCFRHEAWVSGVDELFLMAVCRGEGMFREDVVGGGALGMMQIMPKTGAHYGYSEEMLLQAHYNIEFGAAYVSRFVDAYGDIVTAMSAYNQGPGQVSTGSYRTDYAERILLHESRIAAWVRDRGYSTEFEAR